MCSTLIGSIQNRHIAITFIFLFNLHLNTVAQVNQTNHFELPLRNVDVNFEVIAAEENGLILERRISFPAADHIEILKLDTAFNKEWHGYMPIDKKLIVFGKRISDQHLYILCRHVDQKKKDFELFAIHIGGGKFSQHSIKNFIPFSPTEIQITTHALLVGGYFNTVPVVLFYSFENQKSKVLPGLFNDTGELTHIKTYEDNSFDVLISARNTMAQKTIWIKNYDRDGNLLRNFPLNPDGNKHLIFARSLKTDNDMQLVTGVYGARNSAYSKGIFIASIDPNGLQQTKYYNYGDLENFFKYMKAKREQRVKERIVRRKIRGKKIRFNYRFMLHEIVPFNNQFVMLGEAFYPQYTSMDHAFYNGFFTPRYYANSIIRDGRIFDGFRYTHAVVVGFDPQGNIIWDNSFEINDVKTFTLEQYVKLEIKANKIALLYLFENGLRTKIIQGNEVLEGKTFERLESSGKTQHAKNERITNSKLDYWYNDKFYAAGVKELVNSPDEIQRVFFISKISYDDE